MCLGPAAAAAAGRGPAVGIATSVDVSPAAGAAAAGGRGVENADANAQQQQQQQQGEEDGGAAAAAAAADAATRREDYRGWLAAQKEQWRRSREARKRKREGAPEAEAGRGGGGGGGAGRLAQRLRGAGADVAGLFQQQAASAAAAHWQIVSIAPTQEPGGARGAPLPAEQTVHLQPLPACWLRPTHSAPPQSPASPSLLHSPPPPHPHPQACTSAGR